MNPTPPGPNPTSASGEYVWPAIGLKLRDEEDSLGVDYKSKLEKRLLLIPFFFLLIASWMFAGWFDGDIPLIMTTIFVGLAFGLAVVFFPFNEYYRVDRHTGEIRSIKAYGRWEWGRPLGNLRNAVFFGFDGRYGADRYTQFWTYQLTLFFKDGTTTPLSNWKREPRPTLEPHVAALEKALKIPYRALQVEAERKAQLGPFSPDTSFDYYEGEEAKKQELKRAGIFFLKVAAGAAPLLVLVLYIAFNL